MTPLSSHTRRATALVGALLPPDVPEGHILRSWLDSWSDVGHVLDAMTAAGSEILETWSPYVLRSMSQAVKPPNVLTGPYSRHGYCLA
jgi:hypothetical protein